MSRYIDFKVVDEQAASDLYEVSQKIDKLCKKPTKSFTEDDHIKLNNLLVDRAELASKATGLKISSIFDRK